MSDIFSDPTNIWQGDDAEPSQFATLDVILPRRTDKPTPQASRPSMVSEATSSQAAVPHDDDDPILSLLETPTPVSCSMNSTRLTAARRPAERYFISHEHRERESNGTSRMTHYQLWHDLEQRSAVPPPVSPAMNLFGTSGDDDREVPPREEDMMRRDEEDVNQESARHTSRYEEINSYVKKEIELFSEEIIEVSRKYSRLLTSVRARVEGGHL